MGHCGIKLDSQFKSVETDSPALMLRNQVVDSLNLVVWT